MPLFGAHMSISGGLEYSIKRVKQVKGEALQFFSKNQRQWKIPKFTSKEIELFLNEYTKWGNYPLIIHTSYLLNLASPDKDLYQKSIQNLIAEFKIATLLNVSYIVTHPGSHRGKGIKLGISLLANAIIEAFEKVPEFKGILLVENTCGAGNLLGGNLKEFALLKEKLLDIKIGFCLDTAHLFGFGYDFRTSLTYQKLKQKIKNYLDLSNIKLWHLNDSLCDLGSKKDKHFHIGQGTIGLKAFSFIVQDKDFQNLPMIIETPKDKTLSSDKKNLQTLKQLAKQVRSK